MNLLLAVEDDYESLPSDVVNFSTEDTDSDDENEGDDEKEEQAEHSSNFKDQKRHSVAGASISENEQAKVEKKEPKKQSQVTTDHGR